MHGELSLRVSKTAAEAKVQRKRAWMSAQAEELVSPLLTLSQSQSQPQPPPRPCQRCAVFRDDSDVQFQAVIMIASSIRRHGSDVYLGMCPIKMATPILMYYGASAKLAKRRRRTIEGYG